MANKAALALSVSKMVSTKSNISLLQIIYNDAYKFLRNILHEKHPKTFLTYILKGHLCT